MCLEHNISVSNTPLPMSFTHSCENNKPFTASSLSPTPTSTSQLSVKKCVKSETFISTCLICYFNCIKVINIVYSKMQWSAMYWAYVKYIIGGYALITGQKLDWTSPYINCWIQTRGVLWALFWIILGGKRYNNGFKRE